VCSEPKEFPKICNPNACKKMKNNVSYHPQVHVHHPLEMHYGIGVDEPHFNYQGNIPYTRAYFSLALPNYLLSTLYKWVYIIGKYVGNVRYYLGR
jgi:hypothetical protein